MVLWNKQWESLELYYDWDSSFRHRHKVLSTNSGAMMLKGLFTPSPNKTARYVGYFMNDPNPRGGVYNDNIIPFTHTYPRQYL